MVRQVMKRWEFESGYGWPIIKTKRPQSISIGFEWEVQMADNWDVTLSDAEHDFECDTDALADVFTQDFANMYRFNVHGECGATEFASPASHNLETTKALARKLLARVSKDRLLSPHDSDKNGIHVHTGFEGSYRDYVKVLEKVGLMLNRESSYNFLWSFSGRENCGYNGYRQQAEATCWDTEGLDIDEAMEEILDKEIIRENEFSGKYTIEYRMFNGTADRLLPAIEFSHACTKFCVMHKGDEPPHLVEFKNWLMKQRGYKFLKMQNEWIYVK